MPTCFDTSAHEIVDRGAHGVGHLLLAAGVHHHVRDPAHQVFAEADLRVHDARRGDDLAARQVAQMRGDRRRSDVDRDAVHALAEPRPHGDDLRAAVHGDRHLPRALAQRRLQLLQHAHVAGESGQSPLEFERVLEAAQVAGGVVHVGRLHFDVVEPHDGIELDVVRFGGFAHHLPVHLAVGRHVDDHVAQDLRRAGESSARRHRRSATVLLFDGAEWREIGGARGHAMFREFALGQHYLAATAESASAADGIDVHAKRARGLQERGAEREASAAAGRGEDDQRVFGGHRSPPSALPARAERGRAPEMRVGVTRASFCPLRGGRAPSRHRRPSSALRGIS